jgi:hypothetical protein
MPKKKGVQVVITGVPRPKIDVDAMMQIIIALGRELATRKQLRRQAEPDTEAGSAP